MHTTFSWHFQLLLENGINGPHGGACPVTCGKGDQTRERTIRKPARNGEALCQGKQTETKKCYSKPCRKLLARVAQSTGKSHFTPQYITENSPFYDHLHIFIVLDQKARKIKISTNKD